MIPYGRQNISNEDIQAVVDVLKSEFLTQGPVVPDFESAISAYCGGKYSVAVNSATSALHIACLSLGVGPGDVVWTSPITFVASANCALYCGAEVDFVDIDPLTYNMSVDCLARKLEDAEKDNRLPKVIIPVHMCGQSCDMKNIYSLSQRYGFRIIEDASHAVGAKYEGEIIGGCRYSDITIFSFHPVKIITTAEGGVAVTNHRELSERMRLYRSHGITRDPLMMNKEPEGSWYYEQINLGYNYRMTDIQAALGKSQLTRLDKFIFNRHQIATRYNELLCGLPIQLPVQHEKCYSAFHLYVVRLKRDKILKTRREVFDFLRESNIGVNVHYIPVYHQPYYRQMGFVEGYCPEAERYYSEAISLPIFYGLTEEEQDSVIKSIQLAISA